MINEVIENVISMHSRGVSLKLVGTRWGLSFKDIERLFVKDIQEYRNRLPRCVRNCRWDAKKRLKQLEEFERSLNEHPKQ